MIKAIYKDPQNLEGFLGLAIIEEFIDSGLPFAIKDNTFLKQKYYKIQKWKATWLYKTKLGKSYINPELSTVKFRVLFSLSTASNKERPYKPELIDKFLEVNGKQIF